VEAFNCLRLLNPQHHPLGYTKEEIRVRGALQELEMHVLRDDQLDWPSAKRDHHTIARLKRARTEQRSAAQERDNAILR
jgi:hypothetical protein